jgi:hypothetical protein
VEKLCEWAKTSRAPILALDPPYPLPEYLPAKWQLSVGLPLEPPLPPKCELTAPPKLYMMDLCIPKKLYEKVGIRYESPFESKYVIPLHPRDTAT